MCDLNYDERYDCCVLDVNSFEGIFSAICREHDECFQRLLDEILLFGEIDMFHFYRRQSILHYASELGRAKYVSLLIKKGAKIDIIDELENTPLHSAISYGQKEIVEILLDNVLDINKRNYCKMTPLHLACRSGSNIDFVNFLLLRDANINKRDICGNTPLHISAMKSNVDCVKFLLQNGADTNIKNKKGLLARDMTKIGEIQKIIDEHQVLPS